MHVARQARTEKSRFIVLQAVVVIATLQEAWDHSRDITVMMTAIAAAVVQTTLSLTTTKTTVGSSKQRRDRNSREHGRVQHKVGEMRVISASFSCLMGKKRRGRNTCPFSAADTRSHFLSI